MTNEKPIEELVVDSMHAGARMLSAHPTSEKLLMYHRGELPAHERDEVLRHIGGCPDCADQVLFYADFPMSFSDRISAFLKRAANAMKSFLLPGPSLVWNLGRGGMLAAMALIVVSPTIKLSRANAAMADAKEVIAELSQPQGQLDIFHFTSRTRRMTERAEPVVVDAESTFFAIAFPAASDVEDYVIKILDRENKEVWISQKLQKNPEDFQVRLALSKHFLEAGKYWVEVSAFKNGVLEASDTYPVVLEYL